MKTKCHSCSSCGMPMEHAEDFALGNTGSDYCRYCVDTQGKLLSYDIILKNNAHYLQESQGISETAAIKMAKDLLAEQPTWKNLN